MTPTNRKRRPDMMGDRNPMRRPEVRAKVAATMRAKWQTSEYRTKNTAFQNHHHTPEARTKISAAILKLGDNHPMKRPEQRAKRRGDNNPMKRPEVAAKFAAARKGKCCGADNPMRRPEIAAKFRGENNPMKRLEVRAKFIGDKNPAWRGGISRDPYAWEFSKELKEATRQRDGYQCQLCGKPQAECRWGLVIHHIDYNKKNSDPTNLITLCRECNSQVNTNREYWKAMFSKNVLKGVG